LVRRLFEGRTEARKLEGNISGMVNEGASLEVRARGRKRDKRGRKIMEGDSRAVPDRRRLRSVGYER